MDRVNAGSWKGRRWALWLSVSLLGCGGGGTSSTSELPASERALPLSSQNYADVAQRMAGYPELALMAAQLAADWSEALSQSKGAAVSVPCDGGGTLRLQLTDKDASAMPSAGDQIQATLSQCYVRVLDEVIEGTAMVDLTSPAAGAQWSGTWRFGAQFLTVGSAPIQLEGDLGFDTRTDALTYRVHATSSSRPLVISAASGPVGKRSETVTELDVVKEVRRDTAKIVSSWSFRLASELLGGSIRVTTRTPVAGGLDRAPDVGRLEAVGTQGDPVVLQASANALGLSASLGALATSLSAQDVSTGYLWWAVGISAPGPGSRGYLPRQSPSTTFELLQKPASTDICQKPVLSWQFSRPLAVPLTAVFRRVTSGVSGYDWSPYETPADVNVQGAYVTVTPRTGLQPGIRYELIWSASARATDDRGSDVPLGVPTWLVVDSVSASAGAGDQIVFGRGAALTLDGRASRVADGSPVASAQWRQVSGPPLQITNANSLTPTVALVTDDAASGSAELELEVRDAQGEFDRDRVTINVINDGQPFILIAVQASGRAPVYTIRTGAALASNYARVFLLDTGLQVLDVISGPSRVLASQVQNWQVGQSQVVDGVQFNAVVVDPSLPFGCSALGATWTVSDWLLNPFSQGRADIGRLAWDMGLGCPGLGTVKVAVRVNSTAPLRW